MKKILLFIAVAFVGMKANAQAVAEYNFNNSNYTDINGNNSFVAGVNVSFTTDRHGNTNGALAVGTVAANGGGGTTATIANLPIGNQARTVSFWISCNNTLDNNNYFNYGSAATNAAFGLGKFKTTTMWGSYAQITNKLNFYGYGNDLEINPYTTNPTTWTHFVVSYSDADVASIYINGVLTISAVKAGWNTTSSVFRLGKDLAGANSVIAYYDDLKIYNRAITQTEVDNLYYANNINPSPEVSSIIESPTSTTSRTIKYNLIGRDQTASSVINYGTSIANLSSQIAGGSASGNGITATSGVLTGLTIGQTYYYQIEAINTYGTSVSTIKSFIHVAPMAIAEYSFDNTYNNILGANPFTAVATTSFTADRNSNPAKAMYIDYTGTTATIPNLPYGKNARTVSMWHRDDNIYNLDYNYSFHYGAIGNGYGFRFKPLEDSVYGSAATSLALNSGTGNATGTWYHFVCTYDGVNSKLYRNGVLISTIAVSWDTVNNSDIFSLGFDRINGYPNRFKGAVDDLKIYNYVLSDAEITSLYTNNTLSTQNFQTNTLKATIYPNPASENFIIEIEDELKSVEIYSLLGQKVMTATAKNVNISSLSKGIYMVRIEDKNKAVATQKLIIE